MSTQKKQDYKLFYISSINGKCNCTVYNASVIILFTNLSIQYEICIDIVDNGSLEVLYTSVI